MFLTGRPTQNVIDRFRRESQDLPFSYGPVGLVRTPTAAQHLDESTVAVGCGQAELFEVVIDPRTEDAGYRIRATSRPQATRARFGQPVVRTFQARFRDHSVAAMKLATRSSSVPA